MVESSPLATIADVKQAARHIGRTLAIVIPVVLVLSGTLAVTRVPWATSGSDAQIDQLREEKADQSENASVETRSKAGEESGAELMLMGTINSIVDKEGGKSVVFYQVNLELVNIESNRKLWIGDKKIKKYITKSAAGL